jgi:hypothetical protein
MDKDLLLICLCDQGMGVWQGVATPETVLWPFQGLPARMAGSLRPSSTPLYTPRHMPMPYAHVKETTSIKVIVGSNDDSVIFPLHLRNLVPFHR